MCIFEWQKSIDEGRGKEMVLVSTAVVWDEMIEEVLHSRTIGNNEAITVPTTVT
jgi:hypothetical protein